MRIMGALAIRTLPGIANTCSGLTLSTFPFHRSRSNRIFELRTFQSITALLTVSLHHSEMQNFHSSSRIFSSSRPLRSDIAGSERILCACVSTTGVCVSSSNRKNSRNSLVPLAIASVACSSYFLLAIVSLLVVVPVAFRNLGPRALRAPEIVNPTPDNTPTAIRTRLIIVNGACSAHGSVLDSRIEPPENLFSFVTNAVAVVDHVYTLARAERRAARTGCPPAKKAS